MNEMNTGGNKNFKEEAGNVKQYGVLSGGGEMGELIRSKDWSKTPLGPHESWPPVFRSLVGVMLRNTFPQLLWWGPDYIQIYNDGFKPITGIKHPQALGQKGKECWSEFWDVIADMVDTPFNGGEATWMEDLAVEMNRFGFPEETHFTLAYSPVPDETAPNGIGGVLATVHEISAKIIGERRIILLRDLGMRTIDSKTEESACEVFAKTVSEYGKDVPFSLIYLIDPDGKSASLAATAGVEAGKEISPLKVSLTDGEGVQPWPFTRVLQTESMELITSLGEKFKNIPPGPWADAPHTAVVLPIPSTKAHYPAGFLIAGISCRLPFNDQYETFLKLLTNQLSTAISNARAYEEEKKRLEELAEIDRAKTAFFSNVSHEFRTPLTLMLGPLEDTLSQNNGSLSPKDREQLKTVYENTLRLLKLVSTLLDFSRIEAKRLQATFEPTDLSVLTKDLASAFESAIKKAGLKYNVNCQSISDPIYVDPEMWEKIVLNMISNALKFTFEGEIRVALDETETHARLIVQDTGVGIPEEELSNLFKRFHRVRNSRSRSHEGTGIGLSLVKELVEIQGGTIEVAGAEGQGTTFTVSIPKGKEHLNQERVSAETSEASTATKTEAYVNEALLWDKEDAPAEVLKEEKVAKSAGNLQPDKDILVLLVDDNADMRNYLKRLLSDYWKVETAKDGTEALAAAKENKPDLILSDVMMPDMNGFELLAEVRNNDHLKNVPVMLLSARAGEEATIEGLEKGADDYLVKPFSARELIARVKTQLEITRTRQDNTELRAAEEELKKFKILTDHAFDEFILTREDGSFAYLNDLVLNHWGYTKEEGLQLTVPDVNPAFNLEEFKDIFALAQKQSISSLETFHKRKDGSVYPVEVNMGEIVLNGQPHLFAVARDITKRKSDEKLLILKNEQLVKTNNDLDNFIYTASHDLKSPISNIEGLVTILRKNLRSEYNFVNEKTEDIIQKIEKSVERFKSTILDLTEIAKVQKPEEEEIHELNFGQIVEDAKLSISNEIENSGVKIETDFSIVPVLKFSKKNITSVMYNLLSNAIKFRDPGRPSEIFIKTELINNFIILSVEDNGLGIQEKNIPGMFSMFKRYHNHLEGTGIGLYIVKRIIDNACGKIEVKSEVGKGTIFKVYFKNY